MAAALVPLREEFAEITKVKEPLAPFTAFKVGGPACSPYYLALDESGAVSLPLRTLFSQEMIRGGVLMPFLALSYRHGEEELAVTERAVDAAFAVYKRALKDGVGAYLEGPVIKPVFRTYN